MEACVAQARDLLDSAHLVIEDGKPHVGYSLAVASLEELGKRNLMGIQQMSTEQDLAPDYATRRMDDHEQKLFWALFGGSMFDTSVSVDKFNRLMAMARNFHAKRLAGMYVDQTSEGLNVPRAAVTA